MKKTRTGLLFGLLLCALIAGVAVAEDASPAIVEHARTKIVELGTDPVFVAAVKAQNARHLSLDQIKELDKRWIATPGVADYMKELIDSPCGQHLREIQDKAGYYAEMFVMDNQGANVCMTDKTSDYWQGDEDKFIKSYNGGAGAVFIDKVKFDDSTQSYLVQVSVPVKDGEQVIGAITVGIDVDAFERH